ncbi:hypothetical protein VP01_164g11 [Puccinia sorghi]|uniref:Uncharacterized protein n=1 Tax=Puccinia sorghi TaxID=27349 RepID=A0A0L6VIF6_9BASI|nr:hypothetical protein VP01_164g11 [Puccinia sorghi]
MHLRHCYSYKHHGGGVREFMVVLSIKNQYPKVTTAIPTQPFRHLLFLFGIGKVEDEEEVMEPSKVVSLAAYWLLDNNVFSIPENGMALIPSGYDAYLNITGHECFFLCFSFVFFFCFFLCSFYLHWSL